MAKGNTTYIKVKGKVKWAKVYEPDVFNNTERFIMNFYPADGGEWEKITKSGIQLVPVEDEDGKFIKPRRDHKRLINDEVVFFTPPEISGAVNVRYEVDGKQVWSYHKGDKVERVGEKKLIGNGSTVVLDIAVFDTAKDKGHRLMSINVLDLVEYEAAPRENLVDTTVREALDFSEPSKVDVKPKSASKDGIDW